MNIKIISLNINGIRQKTQLIDDKFIDYDILCIQESKLNEKIVKINLFKNFTDFHFIDINKQGQKGVSFLFNNNSINNKKFSIKSVNEIVLNNNLGRICICNILFNNYDIFIINLYAQHISNIKDIEKINNKKKFYLELSQLINTYKNKHLIVLGDFNANKNRSEEFIYKNHTKIPPGFNDIEMIIYNDFLNKTKLQNLYTYYGIYSFYSQRTKEKYIMFKHNKGLTVDAIMINNHISKIIKNYKFNILDKFYTLSDHLPLLITLHI
jgi:hypothetical protein